MTRSLLMLVACAGCDGVFGLPFVPTPPPDAPAIVDAPPLIDSPPRGALYIVPPQAVPIWVGDMVPFQAFVHGPPSTIVTMSARADVGTVSPTSGMVSLDGNGIAPFDVTYTAPSSPGSDTLTLDASAGMLASEQPLGLTVAPLTSVGLDAPQQNVDQTVAGLAIGARITVGLGGGLRKVGFYTTTAGSHVRAAVYTAAAAFPNYPDQQVSVALPQTVVVGRNEVAVPPVTLAAGDYWVIVVFDATTGVEYKTPGLYGYDSWAYATPFQATWPSGWNDIASYTYAFFLRIGM